MSTARATYPAVWLSIVPFTHSYAFDFFLQAHAGRVGTARPTHYICLLDEIAMTPDMMQQLVHSLCYSFSRCTSSVSVVPVGYIAGKSTVVWLR